MDCDNIQADLSHSRTSHSRVPEVVGSRTLSFSRPGLVAVESDQVNITAGPPSSLAIEAGDNQIAPVGTAVLTDPAVIVTDANGNPISGVNVDFNGDGTVVPETVATGANGIATVTSWTLEPVAGDNMLVASVPSAPGLGTETFNATGTAVNQAPTPRTTTDRPIRWTRTARSTSLRKPTGCWPTTPTQMVTT